MSYLSNSIQNFPQTVEKTVAAIKASNLSYDFILLRGVSGLLVGPTVAMQLGKPFIILRKPNDGSHSQQKFETGNLDPLDADSDFPISYIIIDDLISTGTTIKSIKESVEKKARYYNVEREVNLRAVFLYAPENLLRQDENTIRFFSPETLVIHVGESRMEEMKKEREEYKRNNNSYNDVKDSLFIPRNKNVVGAELAKEIGIQDAKTWIIPDLF